MSFALTSLFGTVGTVAAGARRAAGTETPRQLWLGFEQPEPERVPVLPLVAYEQEGGVSMTKGLGAAHAIRLYVEALLA